MSHNYLYRGSTSDTDLRPEAGHYSSVNRRHSLANVDFCRPSQEPFSSSYPPSSSSRGPTWVQDGALTILNSCGLEPSDLALLAELPEDVLTVESLPHVLQQIKGKRGAVSCSVPRASSPSSSYSSSSYRPAPGNSSRIWDHLRSQTTQYPLDRVPPASFPFEQDRWRNSRIGSSLRSNQTASSTSRYAVDLHRRTGPPENGKTGRSGGPFSSQDCSFFSSAGQERRSRLPSTGFSEPRSALPSHVYLSKPRVSHQANQTSSTSRQAAGTSIPSEKEALDFHGTCPTVFPYSCSLCDITVLSETVWIKHINNSQHAEGQLSLLQQFPNWDCRVESGRVKIQDKRKGEEKASRSAQNEKSKPDKKPSEKGKVVCVKFPPQSVDETYLRKLTEPFGKIIQILMFPSLAFLELSSSEQAKELVKFHMNYPPTVNGEQMEFIISNTFSFLQSSQVVSFTPVPTAEDGHPDLISIIKRFGPIRYYLFLPCTAYVEMEQASDAQKLVDYYSSNTLRINNTCIKVSFSGEYKTLVRVPSAKKYEEQKALTIRSRSSSQDKECKRRQSSKGRERELMKSKTETCRSREGARRTRSKSRDKSSPSASRDNSNEKSNRGTRSRSRERPHTKRKTRSRSRDKSKERSCRGSRTRSRSREKAIKKSKTTSNSTDKTSNGSNEQSVKGDKAETESRTKEEPAPPVEVADTQTEEKTALSTEDSDIEGMEVIGEDGENIEEEIQSDVKGKEAAAEIEHRANGTDPLEGEKPMDVTTGNEEQKEGVCETEKPEEETVLEDEQEASDFPVDLENCITLDELEDDQSDNQGKDVKDTAEGFIEMGSSTQARRAAQELTHEPITLNGSYKYQTLGNGRWEIHLASDHQESDGTKESLKETSDEGSDRLAPQKMLSVTEEERGVRKASNQELSRNTTEEESLSEKGQKELPPENGKERDTIRSESFSESKESDGEREGSMEEPPDLDQADSTAAVQKPEKDNQLQDSGSVQTEQRAGPEGGAAERTEATRPVGTEFVRPVVGYFCNLCQLIYADEDEAKQQHCSSLAHYRKYQEKTGKDPWSS